MFSYQTEIHFSYLLPLVSMSHSLVQVKNTVHQITSGDRKTNWRLIVNFHTTEGSGVLPDLIFGGGLGVTLRIMSTFHNLDMLAI